MTSSTWSFDSSSSLRCCGIDAERVARFARFDITHDHPFPFVFSARELSYHRRADNPAAGLCASFCCKEAVFKALQAPYNFTDCELLYSGESGPVPIRLTRSLCRDYGLRRGVAVVRQVGYGAGAEVIVAAYLF